MTETLAATLVVAFFWFVAQAQRGRNWLWLGVSSVVGSVLALVRPNYAFAVPLLFVYWSLRERRNLFANPKLAISILLPFCILVGGVDYTKWNQVWDMEPDDLGRHRELPLSSAPRSF
jgi:riboflavin transporter FmnP